MSITDSRPRAVILGAALTLGPAGFYVASAIRPETAGLSKWVALAGLAIGAVAALLRWRGAAAGIVLVVAAAVFVPKAMWMVRMGRCGMSELAVARRTVEAFAKSHGRPPATLEELGALPPLRIWTVDGAERDHFHPATSRVTLLRGSAAPPDDGGWGYDPDTGRVFLSCTGLEPKVRRHSLYEL